MDASRAVPVLDEILAILRAHGAELREQGVRHLAVFGSVARGEAEASSDVDLAVEIDPSARMDLFRRVALERRLADVLGRPVDLLPEPAQKLQPRMNIERDRRRAF